MLIMWRRSGESFLVGDGVEIEILDARTNRVKLGIVAPESVLIVRKEARAVREENLAAALSVGPGMIQSVLRNLPAPIHRNRNPNISMRQIIDTASASLPRIPLKKS